MKKYIYIIIGIIVLGGIGFLFMSNSKSSSDNQRPTVKASRSTIVDKVLAVGTIEPLQEIQVKSKVSGVVSKIYNDAGSYVRKGDPLIEIKPDPTPTELAEATRNLAAEENNFNTVSKEKERQEAMKSKGLISNKDYEDILQQFNSAKLKLEGAKDRMALLKQGRVSIQNVEFTSIVRAEMDGYVLQKMVNIGDPVVPSTNFQPGMVLMTLADMNSLIFKGTVDEINVGKLKIGMPVELKIGALPKDAVKGKLTKISLKAIKKDNATNFDVEIELLPNQKVQLRAGYSANADIIINKKENVLSLPERVITFSGDSTFVMLPDGENEKRVAVKTGLSDAINIEIIEGIQDSTAVLEPKMKMIE